MKWILNITVAALAWWAWGTPASAHEISDNRATLVLRDHNHVSLTLYVDLINVLHQILSPTASLAEFVLIHAAMAPDEFNAALVKAEAHMEAQLTLVDDANGRLSLDAWQWPTAAAVHSSLRELSMQTIVAPTDHTHLAPSEIHADFRAIGAVTTLRARFPEELGRVLVVSYRPNQIWAMPQSVVEVRF